MRYFSFLRDGSAVPRWGSGGVFAVIALVFALGAITALNRNTDPARDDTIPYLATAMQIRETGGIIGFLTAMLTGTYTQANQHPLYVALLAPFARHDIGFFIQAKLITVMFGFLALSSMFWVLCRMFNLFTAGLATFFLAINPEFLDNTGMVACESLLLCWIFWLWYFYLRAAEGRRHWIVPGIFCGLAYLTKGTGMLFFGAAVISGLLLVRMRVCTFKALGWFLVGFLCASMPLVVRNSVVYHQPFYNINSHVMWMDNWEQFFSEEFIESDGAAFTLRSYLERNGRLVMLKRFWQGVCAQCRLVYSSSRLGPSPSANPWQFGVLSGLFLLGLWTEQRQRRVFVVCGITVYVIFFCWYSAIALHPRFMLALIPFFYTYAGYGMWRLVCRVSPEVGTRRRYGALLLSGLFVCGLSEAAIGSDLSDPRHSYTRLPGYTAFMDWYSAQARSLRTLFGPSRAYPEFYDARMSTARPFTYLPPDMSWDGFIAYLRERRYELVIIDSQMLQRRPLLRRVCTRNETGGLEPVLIPAGWRVVYSDPSPRCDFIMFGIDPEIKQESE